MLQVISVTNTTFQVLHGLKKVKSYRAKHVFSFPFFFSFLKKTVHGAFTDTHLKRLKTNPVILPSGETMNITRQDVVNAGKVAGAGVLGLGIGGAAVSIADNGPTQDEYQNLQNQVEELEEENSEFSDEVAQLETTVTEKQEQIANLTSAVQQREEVINDLQESNADLEEAVAQAGEREGLVDYLPYFGDEDVELDAVDAEVDEEASEDNLGVGDDYEGEEYDAVTADYSHDDGHSYFVKVVTFEDGEDAEEYAEGLEEYFFVEKDFDENGVEDAEVVRDGDTVVALRGSEDAEEDDYDFESVVSQYN